MSHLGRCQPCKPKPRSSQTSSKTQLEIADIGPARLPSAFATEPSEALRDAALSGLGIALLPTWLVAADVREGRLIDVLSDWAWLLAPGPERAIWSVLPPKQGRRAEGPELCRVHD
jgi:DNA-binding transcriptional LysR family regulator